MRYSVATRYVVCVNYNKESAKLFIRFWLRIGKEWRRFFIMTSAHM